jgi:hypothetical protein
MADPLKIGDRNLVTLTDATKLVPYSKDYIAKLARDAKIAAAQFDRQWYIDVDSLKNFFALAQLEVQARAEYTRALRKQELDLHEWWSLFTKTHAERRAERAHKSLQKTIIVVILGMLVGALLVRVVPYTQPDTAVALLGELYAPAARLTPEKTRSDSWYNVGVVTEETTEIDMRAGLLLLPSATSTASATSLFSDPVVLDTDGIGTGTVRLQDGTSTIPVIEVPVVVPIETP